MNEKAESIPILKEPHPLYYHFLKFKKKIFENEQIPVSTDFNLYVNPHHLDFQVKKGHGDVRSYDDPQLANLVWCFVYLINEYSTYTNYHYHLMNEFYKFYKPQKSTYKRY